MPAEVRIVNPLASPDWDRFARRHPDATIFHSSAWARLLHDTYGFAPAYLVRHSRETVVAGWPLMEVGGRLRGRRGVSLPFTDSCPPLLPPCEDPAPPAPSGAGADAPGSPNDLETMAAREPLLAGALAHARARSWKFLELRDAPRWVRGLPPSVAFHGHSIDLSGGLDAAVGRCDGSTRRAIRKAGSAGLRVVEANDQAAARLYYDLHCATRRRHGLPPQPYGFFAALQRHVLEASLGSILLVFRDQTPVAGAIFLFWGARALYKFGASEQRFQALRPNNLLFHEALRLCIRRGCTSLDLGRTSLDNAGLRRFKLGWGSEERRIAYVRYDLRRRRPIPTPDRASGWHTLVFKHLPRPITRLVANLGYRFAA